MKNWLIVLGFILFIIVKGACAEEIKEIIVFEKLSEEEISFLLAEHNRVRAAAGVDPLEWSEALSLYAEQWANYLAESACILKHRPASGKWKQKYGENLFMGVAGSFGVLHTVRVWESEKKISSGVPVEEKIPPSAANYAQLISGNTQRVGCAKAICSGNMIVVCNYDPSGNAVVKKSF